MTDRMPDRINAGYSQGYQMWDSADYIVFDGQDEYIRKDWLIEQLEGMRISKEELDIFMRAGASEIAVATHNGVIDAMIERIIND